MVGGRSGQRNAKGRSATQSALDRDVPPVSFYDALHDIESQPHASIAACFASPKSLEDLGQGFWIDTGTLIVNRKHCFRAVIVHRESNGASGRAELDGVRHQVPQNLVHPIAVARNQAVLLGRMDVDAHAFLLRQGAQLGHVSQQLAKQVLTAVEG
jgi:hypothetical protein